MCSERRATRALVAVALLAVSGTVPARVLLPVEEALNLAFPGAEIERQTVFLTEAEQAAAARATGDPVPRALVVRYVARREGLRVGTAYVDTHRVRTLEESVFVAVTPGDRIARVEVLSFDEPPDYLPRAGWYEQFAGRELDDGLRLDGEIRSVTGATLTAVATTAAARRVLATHRVIEAREAAP